jgi:hypothetical protein
MPAIDNPALEAFLQQIGGEILFGQVLVRPRSGGFELLHVEDGSSPPDQLRPVPLDEVRQIAQFTRAGEFRPLKCAPNLRSGWRLEVRDEKELERALNQLYPGGLADWHAASGSNPPVTDYREFTGRQTGMYRITEKLSDSQVGRLVRSCCPPEFCLKNRFWNVAGTGPDEPQSKSLIPCLEPCALFLELARKAVRIEQETKTQIELAPSELETVMTALEGALDHPPANAREAEFGAPNNPRRIKLLLEKLKER